MKLLEEFKTFAMKGNVVDMAVGVIIGGAYESLEAAKPAAPPAPVR